MAKQRLCFILTFVVILFSGSLQSAKAEVPPQVPPKKAISKKPDQPPEVQAADKTANPLERAIQSMRAAQQRLANSKLDRQTQSLQKSIIKDLDELIKLAKQHQSANNNSQPQPKDQPQPSSTGKPEEGRQNASRPNGTEPGEPNPDESSEQIRNDKDKQQDQRLEQGLVSEVWGHLPPRLRKRLRSNYNGQYLKRYEELVRRYFQALAEEGRKTESRRSLFRD